MSLIKQINELRLMVEGELVDCSDILCIGSFDDVKFYADLRMKKRLEKAITIIDYEHGRIIRIPTNSCYREFYSTCGNDYNGLTDIRDPRGHWAGLAIDVSLSRLAWAIWNSRAFAGKKRSYGNLLKEYEQEMVHIFKRAGLYRIFWGNGGEWWHFSRRSWRPKQAIRKLRWKLGVKVKALG